MANIQEYWKEVRKTEADLATKFGGEVHVTSVFNRDKGTNAGSTCSASPYLAAMGIVNQTHRISTSEEVEGFKELQRDNLRRSTADEQRRKQQFIVVVDPNQSQGSTLQQMPPAALTTQPSVKAKV